MGARPLRNYLGEVPLDPWGNPFIYQFPHPKQPGTFDLRSAGPDGKKDTIDVTLGQLPGK